MGGVITRKLLGGISRISSTCDPSNIYHNLITESKRKWYIGKVSVKGAAGWNFDGETRCRE
jgi:hypothetical protein